MHSHQQRHRHSPSSHYTLRVSILIIIIILLRPIIILVIIFSIILWGRRNGISHLNLGQTRGCTTYCTDTPWRVAHTPSSSPAPTHPSSASDHISPLTPPLAPASSHASSHSLPPTSALAVLWRGPPRRAPRRRGHGFDRAEGAAVVVVTTTASTAATLATKTRTMTTTTTTKTTTTSRSLPPPHARGQQLCPLTRACRRPASPA